MLTRPRFLCALAAIAVFDPPGSSGEGALRDERRLRSGYSVSQKHSLNVREDALIDIVLSIDFNVDAGSVLSGSHKTILSDFGLQSLRGPVSATDGAGRSLPLRTSSNSKGWFKVEFDFSQPVVGTVSPHYTVNLAYTVSNGICVPSAGRARFGLPWAHRWAVRVRESRYEIAFANPSMDMGNVCLGTAGFRPRCGASGLTISGTQAAHKVSGSLHGVFFDWAAPAGSLRSCSGGPIAREGAGVLPPDDEEATSDDESDSKLPEDEGQSVAGMSMGIAAMGAGLLVGGAAYTYRKKKRINDAQRWANEVDKADFEVNTAAWKPGKDDDKLALDLESDLADTESTVASDYEKPILPASRRMAQQIGTMSSVSEDDSSPCLSSRPTSPQARTQNGNQMGSPQTGGSKPRGKDTGAGIGSWAIPEEFGEQERAALNEIEYAILVTDHSPSIDSGTCLQTLLGKASSDTGPLPLVLSSSAARAPQEQPVEMLSIELDISDAHSVAPDQFELQEDCKDVAMEDNFVNSSNAQTSESPTMALALNDTTSHQLTSADTLRSLGQMEASIAAVVVSRSWEPMDEFDAKDAVARNTLLQASLPTPAMDIRADSLPQNLRSPVPKVMPAPPASPNSLLKPPRMMPAAPPSAMMPAAPPSTSLQAATVPSRCAEEYFMSVPTPVTAKALAFPAAPPGLAPSVDSRKSNWEAMDEIGPDDGLADAARQTLAATAMASSRNL